MAKKKSELRQIPGVGPSIEGDLIRLGCSTLESLRGADPEELFLRHCALRGFQDDRCLLYVFRLAVYWAEHEEREPEKTRWWYWKNHPYPPVPEGEHAAESTPED